MAVNGQVPRVRELILVVVGEMMLTVDVRNNNWGRS